MAELNFITIKDHSSSGAIWNGVELYMMASRPLNISSKQNSAPKIKNFQNISDDDDTDYAANYDRRKAYINYGGFNNAVLSLDILYNPVMIGTTFTHNSAVRAVFTPSKLYELILQPRTVYIQDEFLIRDLLSTIEGTSSAIYTSKGMPVVLNSWSMTPALEGKEVVMSLSFIEDKEIS